MTTAVRALLGDLFVGCAEGLWRRRKAGRMARKGGRVAGAVVLYDILAQAVLFP